MEAIGPPSANGGPSSTSFPRSIAMQPVTTAGSPQSAHSGSTLWRGVSFEPIALA
jgi:hypothetical protein